MADPAGAARMRAKQRQMAQSAAAFLLFVLPTPVLIKGILAIFSGRILMLAWCLALYAVFIVGASLVKRGLALEAEYKARRIARASLLPYKTAGAIILGLATVATAWGVDGATVVAALETARAKLDRIENASKGIRNREFQSRIKSILGSAYLVLDEIENDPRDLRRARKFLNVYLDGAVEVTERYAATYEKTQSGTLEQGFSELLEDMEHVFKEQHDKLLQDDELDLDVQMDVLRQRLRREGVM